MAPPAVPDDLDPSVNWEFELPIDLWERESFAFRILDARGQPILTERDLGVSRHPVDKYAALPEAAFDTLDRFMARHRGETVTIEIEGEPPIRREVYGRLSGTTYGRGPVYLHGSRDMPPAPASSDGE